MFYVALLLIEDAQLTWYGNEFVGRHHAAYWHQQVPAGFSDTMQPDEFGVAAPLHVPFGTRLRLTRLDTGATVEAVVVDRMRNFRNPNTYDAYPAVAQALGFGPWAEEQDCGVVRVKVEIIREWRDYAVSMESQPQGNMGAIYFN